MDGGTLDFLLSTRKYRWKYLPYGLWWQEKSSKGKHLIPWHQILGLELREYEPILPEGSK